jgi:hypothetical protein
MYHDGAWAGTGDTALFLAYKRHPAVARHLAGAHLGGADEDARDWLLVDQAEQLLYLAAVAEARLHLAAQWPRDEGPPLEVTQEELASLRDAWREAASPPDWRERLAESVRESRANYRLMQQWLNQQYAGER